MLLWSRPSTSSVILDRPRLGAASKVLLSVLAIVASGCARQGEGQRCDPLSGSEDCDDGLVCVALDELRNGEEGAVCCPTDNPTENICQAGEFDITVDGGTMVSTPPAGDAGTTSSPSPSDAGDTLSSTSAAVDAASVSAVSSSSESAPSTTPLITSVESSAATSEPITAEQSSTGSSVSADAGTGGDAGGASAPDAGP